MTPSPRTKRYGTLLLFVCKRTRTQERPIGCTTAVDIGSGLEVSSADLYDLLVRLVVYFDGCYGLFHRPKDHIQVLVVCLPHSDKTELPYTYGSSDFKPSYDCAVDIE